MSNPEVENMRSDGTEVAVQPTWNKHNLRLRLGQKFSTRRPCRVFMQRFAEALGTDLRNDAESVLTSRTFAE
ncbi:hypothetical protein DPMN_067131 [Dreissena polymorpha]|uniref:Uncharacterized protein n=1 Tax=Dreissena polymorpha TaxID=45954 RepID=A0A9D4BSK8_DREPO|nr:hypothetical protein DPMN_067131 [Dreissena polymorpha]